MTAIANNTKTLGYIKFSKLQEKAYLCDVDMDLLFDTFKQFYREGESSSVLFGILCDNLPDLRGISTADEEELLEVLEKELKRRKAKKTNKSREQQISDTAEIMHILKQRFRFVTAEDTKEIYYYKDGVFEEATTLIEMEVEAHFNDTNSTYFTNEIINHLRRETYTRRNKFNADKTRIPLRNGLFNLETFELEPFDETKIFTFRFPIMYDPEAKCLNTIAWIQEIVVTQDSYDLLQEFSGYGFEPRFPLHKAIWLHGFGRNGKGAYMRLYEKAIGPNQSSVPLEQMSAKFRFVLIGLFNSFVNVCSEPQSNYVFQTETFKKVTGGDRVEGEIKGIQKKIKFTSFAKFFIMGSKYPTINDITTGFWERMVMVKFPNDYSENFIDYIEDKKIEEDGGEEQALAGYFNWCMEGLKRLKENHYRLSESKSSEQTKLEFEKVSNSIKAFITECVILKPTEKYAQPALWNKYKEYCEIFNLEVQQKSAFTSKIGELRGTRLGAAKIDGKKNRVWFGLTFKECEENIEDIEDEKGGQSGQSYHPQTLLGLADKKNSVLMEGESGHGHFGNFVHPLKCICGKPFDTVEVLIHHQTHCKEFQLDQDLKAAKDAKARKDAKGNEVKDSEDVKTVKESEEIKTVKDVKDEPEWSLVKIPFNDWSRDKLKKGLKAATTRVKKCGDPGDRFDVDGIIYELLLIEKKKLGDVAEHHYKEEGADSTEDFIKVWEGIHKKKGYNPGQLVFYHTFRRYDWRNYLVRIYTCVCDKEFNSIEKLHAHQSSCNEFQAAHDSEVVRNEH